MQNVLGKSKVLIVDDSEMNRSILADILNDEYEIMEADDGLQAMELLGKYSDSISLVLLDIVMPHMDGFSVLAKMNEKHIIDNVPVIIILSENASLYVEHAFELGAMDYIQRPFDTVVVRQRSLNAINMFSHKQLIAGASEEQLAQNESDMSSVVNIMANLIEFGNVNKGYHAENVRAITETILANIGAVSFKYKPTPADIQSVGIASMLHDIGMYCINKGKKSGTDDATEEMQKHTVLGAEMLEKLQGKKDNVFLRRAAEICRYHHERWDGKGYPEGLKGDRIPIAAQVVAVADVYDNLVNKRLNRKAVSHDEAIAKIMNGECGAFNPVLMIVLKSVADTLPAKLK